MGKKSEFATNRDGVIKTKTTIDKNGTKSSVERGGDLRTGRKSK
jgi:hypothetical protein